MNTNPSEILEPIKKRSIAEKVIHQIRLLIEDGQIPPGSRLPTERELAVKLNVSRPSVREALKALILLGVIENRPGSGNYLSKNSNKLSSQALDILFLISKSTILEIFEVRKGMEGWVVSLAAKRRTEDDLLLMKAALDSMKASINNTDKYKKHENEFHMAVVDAAKNNVVSHLMEKLYALLNVTKSHFYHIEDDLDVKKADYERHRQIFRCIEEEDDQGAAVSVLYDIMVFEKKLKTLNAAN